MTTKRKSRFTDEGKILIGVGLFVVLGAVLRDVELLYWLAGLVMGVMVVGWWKNGNVLPQFRFDRFHSARLVLGEPLDISLEVTNPSRRKGAMVLICDQLCRVEPDQEEEPKSKKQKRVATRTQGELTAELVIPEIEGKRKGEEGKYTAHYRIEGLTRGRYHFSDCQFSTRAPLGLFETFCWLMANNEGEQEVIVWPKMGELTRQTKGWLDGESIHTKGKKPRGSGQEGEYYALRKWTTGDSLRQIHWRSTAKHDQLLVRQNEQHQDRQSVIFLDLWQPDFGEEGGNSSEQYANDKAIYRQAIEEGLGFVATIVNELCRRGKGSIQVEVLGQGYRHFSGPPSLGTMHQILDYLAQAAPQTGGGKGFVGQKGKGSDGFAKNSSRLPGELRQKIKNEEALSEGASNRSSRESFRYRSASTIEPQWEDLYQLLSTRVGEKKANRQMMVVSTRRADQLEKIEKHFAHLRAPLDWISVHQGLMKYVDFSAGSESNKNERASSSSAKKGAYINTNKNGVLADG
ncbi:MAG: DUF58 domain-containing protein [Pirellulaceae bacterium]|nr:DUF58 domain-containing protein [Pirellulaceae bacterium]